jgi:hypothetical protein
MSPNENEGRLIEAQEEEDARAIDEAETLVLRIATDRHPESLQQLRELLDETDVGDVDRQLIRVAIWRLLNADRLQLTDDRRLQVTAR